MMRAVGSLLIVSVAFAVPADKGAPSHVVTSESTVKLDDQVAQAVASQLHEREVAAEAEKMAKDHKLNALADKIAERVIRAEAYCSGSGCCSCACTCDILTKSYPAMLCADCTAAFCSSKIAGYGECTAVPTHSQTSTTTDIDTTGPSSTSTTTSSSGGGCFSKSSTTACRLADPSASVDAAFSACYENENNGAASRVMMADLVPGDYVLTDTTAGTLQATRVLVNQHTAHEKTAETLTLITAEGATLSVTADHGLYVDGALIMAAEAKVGATLNNGVLRRIVKNSEAAIINPVTATGTILASDSGAPFLAASHPMWIASRVADSSATRLLVNAAILYVGDVDSVTSGVVHGIAKVVATVGILVLARKALQSSK